MRLKCLNLARFKDISETDLRHGSGDELRPFGENTSGKISCCPFKFHLRAKQVKFIGQSQQLGNGLADGAETVHCLYPAVSLFCAPVQLRADSSGQKMFAEETSHPSRISYNVLNYTVPKLQTSPYKTFQLKSSQNVKFPMGTNFLS